MTLIQKDLLDSVFASVGFYNGTRPNLFFTDKDRPIIPSYYRTILRKSGKPSLSGGIGLYFTEFEKEWRRLLTPDERRLDCTLPLITMIENFPILLEGGVFKPADNSIDLADRVIKIYDLCRELPRTVDEFCQCLQRSELLGRPVSEYVHIYDYFDNHNLYLRKSTSFVLWFTRASPHCASDMYQSLTISQRRRLGQ